MSGWILTLKQAPALRVDMRSVSPAALAELGADAVARHRVHHGNDAVALGELFAIAPHTDGELRFAGDLSRFDRLGWQLAAGTLRVDGAVGDYFGAGMSGGEVFASGNAGLLAACEMSGGRLEVGGDVGDFAASALPGSMDGMRGGTLIVRGSAGARFGDRMRRGSALVFGNVGDFAASRMVAGTIAVAGTIGAHPAYGMRRGTLLALGPAPAVPPTFVGNNVDIGVFWQLLARDLARHGGAFATLGKRCPSRFLGDLAAGGKGELLVVA
ncbi:MAG TPA: formylmethanofuran dehydrogenase subunit C [Methylibium sp.]|nr:formylmethanofuran dehydrogenase subunit C [Methylibium sp.]